MEEVGNLLLSARPRPPPITIPVILTFMNNSIPRLIIMRNVESGSINFIIEKVELYVKILHFDRQYITHGFLVCFSS